MLGVVIHQDTIKKLVLEHSDVICTLVAPVPCVCLLLSFALWLFTLKLFSYLRPIKFMTLPHESLATWLNCITVAIVIVISGLEVQVSGSLCFPLFAHLILKMETNLGFNDFEMEIWLENLRAKNLTNPILIYLSFVMIACFVQLTLQKLLVMKPNRGNVVVRNERAPIPINSNNTDLESNQSKHNAEIQSKIKMKKKKKPNITSNTEEHNVGPSFADIKTETEMKGEAQAVEDQTEKRVRFDLRMYGGLNNEDETENVPCEKRADSGVVSADVSVADSKATMGQERRNLDQFRKNENNCH